MKKLLIFCFGVFQLNFVSSQTILDSFLLENPNTNILDIFALFDSDQSDVAYTNSVINLLVPIGYHTPIFSNPNWSLTNTVNETQLMTLCGSEAAGYNYLEISLSSIQNLGNVTQNLPVLLTSITFMGSSNDPVIPLTFPTPAMDSVLNCMAAAGVTNTASIRVGNDSDFVGEEDIPTSPSQIVLPITLSNFTAQLQGNNNVLLQWVTSSEINGSHFEIESSEDGINFYRIGDVTAAGNSHSEKHYSFLDRDIRLLRNEFKILYYRLRMVDLDGSFSYSEVRVVRLEAENKGEVYLFPNPTHDLLHIDLPGYSDSGIIYYDISDMQGKRVASGQWDDGVQNTQLLYLRSLGIGSGVFFLRLTNGKKVLSLHKIVLISH